MFFIDDVLCLAYYLQFLSFFILIEIYAEFFVVMDFVCRLSIHIWHLRALRIRSTLLYSYFNTNYGSRLGKTTLDKTFEERYFLNEKTGFFLCFWF
ncbi:hypothetical protein Bca4012_020636 [Brassica carinata]